MSIEGVFTAWYLGMGLWDMYSLLGDGVADSCIFFLSVW